MSDRVMLGVRIDPTLKQMIDADPRTNEEVASAALWDEFGGRRKAAVEKRIEHKDRRIAQIKDEIADLESELSAVEQERLSLQNKLEEMQGSDEQYQEDIDDLLDKMIDLGMSLYPDHTRVDDVATDHNRDAVDIVDDLQERADERDLGLPEHRFEEGSGGRW